MTPLPLVRWLPRRGIYVVLTSNVPGLSCWVEYRPRLHVFDAICADDSIFPMSFRMASARKLRTDDLFTAIGFLLRGGRPSKGEPL